MGALWKIAAEMGMTEREIICLQDGHSRQELAIIFGLSSGRISQIKAKAIRKMMHPWRVRLAIELGLSRKLRLTAEKIKLYSVRSLEDSVAAYRGQKGIPGGEDDEEA
jgi:DNA-binding CsgD family transcriptional regulator